MRIGAGKALERSLTLVALVLFAAVAPLLPTTQLKVDISLFAALILVAALYIRARSGGRFERSALDLPALMFLLAAVLATIFSVDRFRSFVPSHSRGEGLLTYIAYIAMALAAARLIRQEIHAVLTAVVISAGLIGAVGLGQYYGVDLTRWAGFEAVPQGQYYGLEADKPGPPVFGVRSYSTLGNPIFLGGYATLLLPVGVGLAMLGTGRRWWGCAVATALLYGAMIGSQTRGAWVASAGGAAILVALMPKSRAGWRRLATLAAVFATMTVIMVSTRPETFLTQRAASTFDLGGRSLRVRIYLWKHTLSLIAQRPVLGWGFSNLRGRFPDLGSPEYIELFGLTVMGVDSPHNDLLHIAFSTGVLGLAAYLWIWVALAFSLWRTLRTRAAMPSLAVALIASLAAYFVWLQVAWTQVGPAHAFWTLGGVAVALGREGLGSLQ